jgi:hypothetical protein
VRAAPSLDTFGTPLVAGRLGMTPVRFRGPAGALSFTQYVKIVAAIAAVVKPDPSALTQLIRKENR